jgi:hypothetical protein
LVVYPISQDTGRFINIVTFTTDLSKEGTVYEDSSTTTTQEVLSVFEGWEEVSSSTSQSKLTIVIVRLHTYTVTKWLLDRYASGRVILAGDSDAVRVLLAFATLLLTIT